MKNEIILSLVISFTPKIVYMQWTVRLWIHWEVKTEESEDEEEIPTMVIDEDQDSVAEKTEEKKDDSKPLVSVEISDEEEIETIAV